MIKRDTADIDMTSDGDFILDEDRGDLGVATTENHRVSMLAILKKNKSSPGDFLHEKMVGVDLQRFFGLPNTPETAAIIKAAIVAELTRSRLFSSRDIDVRVFPMDRHSVAVLFGIEGTHNFSQTFSMTFSYDMRDNRIIPRRYLF